MNGGDLAFPWTEPTFVSGDVSDIHRGLTKREYFAGQAMQAVIQTYGPDGCFAPNNVAHIAIQHADALLAELSKEKKE